MSHAGSERKANRLAGETSSYLRQHMHNPVDWYPWGEEALSRARSEQRPLLVSIGYSACHWCHVMERESFEDDDTAALMNRLFVCIKVDREERPDLDQIYMDTVTGLTGHGGWPLTVFCTPDGSPFYAGTYYPPEPRQGMPSFRQVLVGVEQAWRERRDEVVQSAAQIVEALARRPDGVDAAPDGPECVARGASRMLQRVDSVNGGFGGAPKFPTPTSLDLLLASCDALSSRKARESLDHVVLSCHRMARGGLYDQLGGGFHRYSVDAIWRVPHFEKMLYDQGQLLRTYADAWRRGGASDAELVWPVRETIDFLLREMRAQDGGFFASQDADSEGHEGRFYVWTPAQIAAVLGDARAREFCDAYGVTERGTFEEGASVLHARDGIPRATFAAERAQLLAARSKRIAPGTDEKRVTAWQGLVASGLARAGSLFGEPAWVAESAATVDATLARMFDPAGRLLRVYDRGRAHVTGFLDDHASLLEACLDLDRAGAGVRFRTAALRLADAIASRFFDASVGDLFLTPSDGEVLAQRPRSDHDGATPHSTGLAVQGLLRAAALSGRDDLRGVAERVLAAHGALLERAPEALPSLARAAMMASRGLSVAVIVGADDDARAALAARARHVLNPEDAVLVAAPGERPADVDTDWLRGRDPAGGVATAWICRGVTCSLPIQHPDELAPLGAPATEIS
ncbi:MAG TPA: thioredoxin domain-containing protein [Myxococcota bacterium]|nr:thioredoxin domain-containing protein [Myxococcota bacterium]